MGLFQNSQNDPKNTLKYLIGPKLPMDLMSTNEADDEKENEPKSLIEIYGAKKN